MNTNPASKTILCFGDSNTFGQKPDRNGRFPANVRWTGVLQQALGNNYYVLEEGLGGRTTDLEHYNPDKPSRNGFVYFKACVDSHMPLDCIIIMLGTNDLKTIYKRSADDVAEALRQYPHYVTEYCAERNIKKPQIILVSPPVMDEHAVRFVDSMPAQGIYDEISAQKSRQLPGPIKQVANETSCIFFDAATVTAPGEDGCHIDTVSHAKLAESLSAIVSGA